MDGYKRLTRPSLSGLSKIKADVLRVSDEVVVDSTTLVVDPDNNRVGIDTASPSYPLDVVGFVNSSTGYYIDGNQVLSSTSLGAGITGSSLNSVGTLSELNVTGNVSLGPAGVYIIDSNEVLSSTSLGAGITGSSLTSVGTLGTLAVSGNVGIGTTNPAYNLHINSSATTFTTPLGVFANIGSSQGVGISIGKDTTAGNYGRNQFSYSSSGSNNNAYKMFIQGGTATPSFECFKSGNVTLGNAEVSIFPTVKTNFTNEVNIGGNCNVASGKTFQIDGSDVLSADTLGSGVTSSSLTSLGTVSDLKATLIQCGGTASVNAAGALRFNNTTGEKICFFASSNVSHYSIGVGSSSLNFNSNLGSFTFRKEGTNDDGTQVLEIDDDTVTFTQPITLPSSLPTLTSSMLGYVQTAVPADYVELPSVGTDTTVLSITNLPVGVWILVGQVLIYTSGDTVTVSGVDQTLVSGSTTIAGNYDNLDWILSTSSGRSFNIVSTVSLDTATTQYLKMSAVYSGGSTVVRTSSSASATYFKAIRIA